MLYAVASVQSLPKYLPPATDLSVTDGGEFKTAH
jgi:hypothetical protein